MQLSEFRDLLANDGFAATFQTMGQYRTELLRALDGLRAQADARPAFYAADDLELPIQSNNGGGRIFVSNEPFAGCSQAFYTHPEASAPGLSDEEIKNEALEHLQLAETEVLNAKAWSAGKQAKTHCKFALTAIAELRRALTRASAATVGEASIPSGWRGRLQEMRDASYTYSQYPELAQAVFDSVIDALGEMEAAQSGQRAGVAEEIVEGIEIIDNLIDSVRAHGNYSPESTVTFLNQARQCFQGALAAAPTQQQEGGS